MNKEVQPVLDIVLGLQEAGETGSSLSPKEVLSTFVLANVGAMVVVLKPSDPVKARVIIQRIQYLPQRLLT
jgi:hypothetical protein